jgi:hypothetical protein
MVDPAALIAHRNARFRAWRAYGVPVEGEWRLVTGRPYFGVLDLGCAVCLSDARNYAPAGGAPGRAELIARLVNAERELFAFRQLLCSHLTPLLGADPPEVQEITRLELLAGDPPG